MKYIVSEFMLEGFITNSTIYDLANGFDTKITNKINYGSTLNGNLFVSPSVTPLLNSVKGPYSKNTWTVGTGDIITVGAGRVTSFDGLDGAFNLYKLYTGGDDGAWVTVPYGDSLANFTASAVYNNMRKN